jgi:hypothetical protein
MRISLKFVSIMETLIILSILFIGIFSYTTGTETIIKRIESQPESVIVLKKRYGWDERWKKS